jgi:molybdopterin converting factor small subunit
MEQSNFEVNVRYFGVLELYAGTRSKFVTLPEKSTLQDLMNHLQRENPPAFKNLLTQNKAGGTFIRVMVNEKLIIESNFSIQLESNDVIALLPGISGGVC